MANRAALRAADVDRDQVAERLRRASAEGRLLTEELEERLETALRARTYGELDALIADLPGPRLLARRDARELGRAAPALGVAIAVPIALAVMALTIFAITGVFAAWCLWLAFAWWFFGPRRRRYRGRSRFGGCGGVNRAHTRAHTSRTV